MSDRRFWIRKDREQYFLSGVMLTCIIAGFVSSYWHFADRLAVRQNINMRNLKSPETEQKKLKELQYTPSRLKVGTTQYYKMDKDTMPSVPKLDQNEGN